MLSCHVFSVRIFQTFLSATNRGLVSLYASNDSAKYELRICLVGVSDSTLPVEHVEGIEEFDSRGLPKTRPNGRWKIVFQSDLKYSNEPMASNTSCPRANIPTAILICDSEVQGGDISVEKLVYQWPQSWHWWFLSNMAPKSQTLLWPRRCSIS